MKFYIIDGMIRSEILGDYGTKSITIGTEHANDLSRKLEVNCIKHTRHVQGNKVMLIAQLRRENDSEIMDRVINDFSEQLAKLQKMKNYQ